MIKDIIKIRARYSIGILFLLSISTANAATLDVCPSGCTYSKIGNAIYNSNNGDTILVYSGTYYENVYVYKQGLILRGVDNGGGLPVVDGMGNEGGSINLNADGITLEGFNAINSSKDGSGTGIWVEHSNNNLIKNNIASNQYFGIFLKNSNGNTLNNNNANWEGTGILMSNSSGNTLSKNDVSNNDNGISLDVNCNNNVLNDNNANSNHDYGISLAQSYGNILSGNNASNGGNGFYMVYSNNNVLRGNYIISNSYSGIYLYFSDNNMLKDNTVNSNGFAGIILHGPNNNNIIYNNYIDNSNNYYNVIGASNNIWNITKTSGTNILGDSYIGGNFWGNPSGTGFSQTCTNRGDGFCNSSYIIEPNNTDYLPLTNNPSVCGNTPNGQNIDVSLSPIDIKFDNVQQCGNTSATSYPTNQWSPLPSNYSGIQFYDIGTTANYSNYITINIIYTNTSSVDENSLKIFHYGGGNWIDVTTTLDTNSKIITGRVTSLSPFIITGYSLGTPTPTVTVSPTVTPVSGGNIVRGSSLETIGIMILAICLILISTLRIRKR